MSIPLEILPLLIPLFVIDTILAVLAVVHILRHSNYRFGSRGAWLVISIFILLFGPIIYFAIGRENNE